MSSLSGSRGYGGDVIPKGFKAAQLQNFTPGMMKIFEHMMGQLGPDSYLSGLANGDEQAYAEMEEPALRQFAGMQGNLASRFSGMGTGGRKSSGFQNTANQASADFATQLQANRHNVRQNAIRDLQGYGNSLLQQRPYDRALVQKQQKPGMDWGALAGSAIGAGAGFFMGGPAGAKVGSQGADLLWQAANTRG